MKTKLTGGCIASPDAIARLEMAVGTPLPNEYLEFVATFDGAVPEPNIFAVGFDNDAGVNSFIPVGEIVDVMNMVDGFPDGSFPIAWAECGNFILIDRCDGSVHFWDHEERDRISRLASDVGAFLDQLKPFDGNSIELKPEDVIGVWVDPTLLQRGKQ